MAPRKLYPAILAGVFSGVFSALPLVSLGNCCCLWLVSGGLLAAYLLQEGHGAPITAGDGAAVGWLTGIVSAFVHVVVSVPVRAVAGPVLDGIAQRALRGVSDVPPEMWNAFDGLDSTVELAVAFGWWLVLGIVFSTMGGVVGAVLFRRHAVPRAPASAASAGSEDR